MCIQAVQGPALMHQRWEGAILSHEWSLSRLPKTLTVWMARSDQRKALRELAQDGRVLADLGLTRQQALSEAAKPFWRR